jgi:NADH-quinone oxidoreductase subunit B
MATARSSRPGRGSIHNVFTGRVEELVKWAPEVRSMWPATFGLACCAIEMMAAGGRPLRPVPLRHGGLPGLAPPGRPHDRRRARVAEDGTGPAPDLRPDDGAQVGHLDGRVRIARGGMFNNYALVQGVDQVVPVDVYAPAALPGPETLIHAINTLHEQILGRADASRRRVPSTSAVAERGLVLERQMDGQDRPGQRVDPSEIDRRRRPRTPASRRGTTTVRRRRGVVDARPAEPEALHDELVDGRPPNRSAVLHGVARPVVARWCCTPATSTTQLAPTRATWSASTSPGSTTSRTYDGAAA